MPLRMIKLKLYFLGGDRIRIELCPIKQIREQLGHVSEIDTIKNNLKVG